MQSSGSAIDAPRKLYKEQQAAVRVDSEPTDWFGIRKGVGDDKTVMRESADEMTWIGIKFSGCTINNMRYADDIVLIATSPAAFQQLIDKINAVSREYGLEISSLLRKRK